MLICCLLVLLLLEGNISQQTDFFMVFGNRSLTKVSNCVNKDCGKSLDVYLPEDCGKS